MSDQTEMPPSTEAPAEPRDSAVVAAAVGSGRKLNPWVWILVGVMLVCLAGGGAWRWMGIRANVRAQEAAARDADAHFAAAAKSLATIQEVSDYIHTTDPDWAQARIPGFVSSLKSMNTSASAELDAAEEAVNLLSSGEVRTEYSNAIRSARDAVSKTDLAIPMVAALPDLWRRSEKAVLALREAHDATEAGVRAGNSEEWGASTRSLNKALAHCDTAEQNLRELGTLVSSIPGIDDKGGVSAVLGKVERQRTMVKAQIGLNRLGESGSQSSFKQAADRYNKLVAASNKEPGLPDSIRGPAFFEDYVESVLGSAGDAFDASLASYAAARRAAKANP